MTPTAQTTNIDWKNIANLIDDLQGTIGDNFPEMAAEVDLINNLLRGGANAVSNYLGDGDLPEPDPLPSRPDSMRNEAPPTAINWARMRKLANDIIEAILNFAPEERKPQLILIQNVIDGIFAGAKTIFGGQDPEVA